MYTIHVFFVQEKRRRNHATSSTVSNAMDCNAMSPIQPDKIRRDQSIIANTLILIEIIFKMVNPQIRRLKQQQQTKETLVQMPPSRWCKKREALERVSVKFDTILYNLKKRPLKLNFFSLHYIFPKHSISKMRISIVENLLKKSPEFKKRPRY